MKDWPSLRRADALYRSGVQKPTRARWKQKWQRGFDAPAVVAPSLYTFKTSEHSCIQPADYDILRQRGDSYIDELMEIVQQHLEPTFAHPRCLSDLPYETNEQMSGEGAVVHIDASRIVALDDTNSVPCDAPIRLFHDGMISEPEAYAPSTSHVANISGIWCHTYPFWNWKDKDTPVIRLDILFRRIPNHSIVNTNRYATRLCIGDDNHTSVEIRGRLVFRVLSYQHHNSVLNRPVLKLECVGFLKCTEDLPLINLGAGENRTLSLFKPFDIFQRTTESCGFVFQFEERDVTFLRIDVVIDGVIEATTQLLVSDNVVDFILKGDHLMRVELHASELTVTASRAAEIHISETIVDEERLNRYCAQSGRTKVTNSSCAVM